MFKKLMSFLFEEEEIVEEVHSSPEEIKPIKPIEKEEEDPKSEIPVLNKPKSIFVDLNESTTPSESRTNQRPVQAQTKVTQPPASRARKRDDEPLNYEFSSTISPIFGRKQEKERPVITVQPKIDLETTESILGTIISPIYGIKKRDKVIKKQEKVKPVSTNMSLEDILGVNENQQQTSTQLSLNQQDDIDSKEKEDILMKLFEEDND